MKRLALLIILLVSGYACAQQGNTLTLYHAGAPTGSCGPLMLYVNATTGDLYSCVSGAWHLVSGGGSSPLTTKGDLFGFSTVNARVPVGSDGLCLKADSSNGLGVSYSACAGAATGYQTIQNAAAAITQRTILNWTAGIVCSDNAPSTRSDCALANVSAVSHKFFNAVVLGALSAAEPASTDLADFSTTAPAANGKIPIYDTSAPNAAGGTGAYVPGDPLVQGTQAAGSTTLPNPVVIGGSDYSGTPTVRTAKVDSSGIVQTHETGTPTVTANAGSGTLATSSTQLPAALDGSGFLKTHEQGTAAISAASLPLPTGAAADSSLTTLDTDVKANVTLHAGANLIGKAGFDGTTPGNTNGITQFQPSRTTGTITTSSTSIPVATTGYGVATVTVNGTYAGVTVNFEFSDDNGTTYYPTTCTRTDSNTQEGTAIVLASNKSQAWDCGVFAATNFRVRSSAFTSGTANIGITLSAAPIEPAPTVSVSGTVPVSGTVTTTPPSNASTNVAQVAGNTTDTNSGTKSAGTLRVVLATDQPALTNKLLVTPDSVALPANQSVNVSQINAVTPLMGNGTTGTGSPRVTIASDNTAFAVNAAATLAAETTKVIGTVRAIGNAGAAFDAATGAAVPANAVMGGLKDTAGNTQDALADTNGRQFFKQYPDTTTTSYRASKKFAASSTTDNAVMPGNATNTVLVTKILLTCNQTTAGQINVELLKRSVADTVGTSAAMTAVPMDANYAAAVSAPLSYTGTGPTVGTAVGDLDNLQIGCMAPGTATPNDIFIFHPDKPIVLRGTAQQIAVNVGNAALTGGNITVTFEWEETTTP